MNGVCGFEEGFVGGCEVEGGDVGWEDMGVMCGGEMRNEMWRALEGNGSRLGEVGGRREDEEEWCVSDLVYKSREKLCVRVPFALRPFQFRRQSDV